MKRRNMLGLSALATGAAFSQPMYGMTQERNTPLGKKLKVLVAGAHPDDPETGCGGIMAKYAQAGHEVIAYYLTRGEAGIPGKTHEEAANIRTTELTQACRILKARPLFGGQIDGDTEVNQQRYDEVRELLQEEDPDIIFNHWPVDTHRDHRACSVLIYDAWLAQGKKASMYYYEVMTGIQSQHFLPSDYCDISTVVDQKHKACFVHISQKIKESYPDDHGRMEIFRGMQHGCDYAEAFVHHEQSPAGWIP